MQMEAKSISHTQLSRKTYVRRRRRMNFRVLLRNSRHNELGRTATEYAVARIVVGAALRTAIEAARSGLLCLRHHRQSGSFSIQIKS